MKKIKFLFLIILLSINSCFGLFDSGEDKIVGNYFSVWIDEYSNRNIGIKDSETSSITVIPEYVFSIGHNERYIIAKQHPKKNRFDEHVNDKVTNYFIIDMKNSDGFKQTVFGPFNEEKFNDKIIELKINNLKFNMNYPENL